MKFADGVVHVAAEGDEGALGVDDVLDEGGVVVGDDGPGGRLVGREDGQGEDLPLGHAPLGHARMALVHVLVERDHRVLRRTLHAAPLALPHLKKRERKHGLG